VTAAAAAAADVSFAPRRVVRAIVVHCSATRPSADIGVAAIRRWHTEPRPKGPGWSDVGYHYVVGRRGVVEPGRPVERPGAHVAGRNADTIGVCLVGGLLENGAAPAGEPATPLELYTAPQLLALKALLVGLLHAHPGAEVVGHRDYPGVAKACPCWDVRRWWAAGAPLASPAMGPAYSGA
jgi:N-acetylmuramoyl-L-alanine amidase